MPTPEHSDWTTPAPGVWTATFGPPPDDDIRAYLRRPPAAEAMTRLPAATLPFDPAEVESHTAAGRLVVRLPLPPAVPVLGMGLQFARFNHRGRTRFLRVNSDPQEDTGETHAPVPFFVVVGDPAYAVLIDADRVVTLHVASTVRRGQPAPTRDRTTDRQWQSTPPADTVEAVVAAGSGMRVTIFAGPTALDAVRRYNLHFGGGHLPPRWGLGFWHRTPTRFTADQVADEAREYRRRGFPCDVIGLEPGWHSSAYPCTFEWSPDRFPDPHAFINDVAADGFAVNLWEHPWVAPHAPLAEEIAPLSGSYTVWGGLAPDVTLPAAREVIAAQHDRAHLAAGVSGYKIDECDGSELTGSSWMFPAHAQFPSGRDGEQLRQVYGLAMQRLTEDLFRQHDRRTYGLVRASGPAASPLPYALYTDLYDHRRYVRAMCSASLSGLLFSPEVRSAKEAEDWVRRMQVVCLSPLAMLNAWSSGTKPWSFPDAENAVRKAIEMRMRILPYLYTAFARYRLDGTPPIRAMALFGNVAAPLALADDQFLLGDDLLVAPLFAGQKERKVLLPEGVWHDFETGEAFPGGGEITVSPPLDTIPILAREGAVIPLMPALSHAPRAGETVALEVLHFGRQPGRFALYDDDGTTFAYERGAYRWLEFRVDIDADGTRTGQADPKAAEAGPGLAYGPITWRWLG